MLGQRILCSVAFCAELRNQDGSAMKAPLFSVIVFLVLTAEDGLCSVSAQPGAVVSNTNEYVESDGYLRWRIKTSQLSRIEGDMWSA
jgi:hypothetical protein